MSLKSPFRRISGRVRQVSDIERILWLDWSKSLSILGVVLIHAIHWSGYLGAGAPLLSLAVATILPVQDFFPVSGLLSADALRSGSFSRFFEKRVRPVVWLFVIWQPAVLVYKVVAAQTLPDQRDSGFAAQVIRVLISPIRPNGELWYLWALALYLLASRAIRSWPRVAQIGASAALALVWTSTARRLLGDETWRLLGPGLQHLPECLVFFLVGSLFREQILGFIPRIPSPVLILTAIGYWVFIAAILQTGVADLYGMSLLRVAAATASIIAAGTLLARLFGPSRLGESTLPVYLTHTMIIVGLVALGAVLEIEIVSERSSIAVALALVVASVFASLGIHRAVMRTRFAWIYRSPIQQP